jgi:hypothetical protein
VEAVSGSDFSERGLTMTISRWLSRAPALLILGALLALAACSPNATTSTGSTPTDTPTSAPTSAPTATPTLAPPTCPDQFSATYYTTLPDATFNATNLYAQIPLPPLTREVDNDASGGLRGRQLCSAGTADSILAFMTQNLTQLGWQMAETQESDCVNVGAGLYQTLQCWKNGTYTLDLGINSNTDWLILFRDPDFNA